jgi:hypothetical protein
MKKSFDVWNAEMNGRSDPPFNHRLELTKLCRHVACLRKRHAGSPQALLLRRRARGQSFAAQPGVMRIKMKVPLLIILLGLGIPFSTDLNQVICKKYPMKSVFRDSCKIDSVMKICESKLIGDSKVNGGDTYKVVRLQLYHECGGLILMESLDI